MSAKLIWQKTVIPEKEAPSSKQTVHTWMFPVLSAEYSREPSWLKHSVLMYDGWWSSSWSSCDASNTTTDKSTLIRYAYVSARSAVYYSSVARHNIQQQTVFRHTYFTTVIDGVLCLRTGAVYRPKPRFQSSRLSRVKLWASSYNKCVHWTNSKSQFQNVSVMLNHIRIQSIIFTSVVLEQNGYFFLGAICILYDVKCVIFDHPSPYNVDNSIVDPSNYKTLAYSSLIANVMKCGTTKTS